MNGNSFVALVSLKAEINPFKSLIFEARVEQGNASAASHILAFSPQVILL